MGAIRKHPSTELAPTVERQLPTEGRAKRLPEIPSIALALIVAGANCQLGGLSLLGSTAPWLVAAGGLFANLGFAVAALGGIALARPSTGLVRHAHALLIVTCAIGTISIDLALLERL